ncbi:MAG: HRDC domain-containing protein, partial [Myxococcales bacterium]|nr:HRDC domain-containing protein [Myxococcales bacterium]
PPPAALDALDGETRAVFERLRTHRAKIARARGLPAYVIAHDKTLIAMAARLPGTHAELLEVPGMGPARIEQYGDGFLDAIRGVDAP